MYVDIYFSYKSEQHIVDNYKTRLDVFKTKYEEEKILHMNRLFVSKQIRYYCI